MNKEDLLKNVYKDFFGSTDNKEINEKINNEMPEIKVEKEKLNDTDLAEKFKLLIEQIENLYVDEKSKNTIKMILEYIKSYSESAKRHYIPFNMVIFTNNMELKDKLITMIQEIVDVYKYLKESKLKEVSMYDIKDIEELDKIYLNNNIIILKDIENLLSKDENFKEQFLHKLENYLKENTSQHLTIIVSKNKNIFETIFENNTSIQNEVLNYEIDGINPDVNEIYQEILNKLKPLMNLSQKMQIDLLDYLVINYEKTELPYPEFRDNLIEKIIFDKKIPEYEQNKTIEEIFEELDSLVGLEKVKKVLRDLVSLTKLKEKSSDFLSLKKINLHMVFLGNPGTGKTTVARIVAKILFELNYIKSDKLIEVTSKDLVAEYVGQTAVKTMNVVNKAMGGVLFIDEAYALASGKGEGNSFNEEAVATLIQAMENNRDNLVVIFAGYTKEMQDFLNLNSGIVSRIGYNVEFEDYTEDELIKIFEQMMNKAGFIIENEAIEELRAIIKVHKNDKNFGNARFIRNVYEKSIIKHASNTENKKSKKALKTITKQDISTENLI